MTPGISIEQIHFRYDDRAAALPLAVNMRPIVAPEWVRGLPASPAAYRIPSRPGTVQIEVTFSTRDPAPARIRGRRAGDTVSGVRAVQCVDVTFDSNGVSPATRCDVELRGGTGVGIETVEWVWEVERDGDWQEFDRTIHEIGLVLDDPCAPWSTDQTTTPGTTPWWEVVRLACDAAVGARRPEEVMTRLTHVVHHRWSGRFAWGPSTGYTSGYGVQPGHFDCAGFLRLLDGPSPSDVLDCSDTAAVVSTFAAILGCRARQRAISVVGNAEPLLMVGRFEWRPPNGFGLHEFGELDGGVGVWDPCLELNTSGDPSRPASPALPQGMASDTYLALLLGGCPSMSSLGREPISRPIGTGAFASPALETDPLVNLAAVRLSLSAVLPTAATHDGSRVARVSLAGIAIEGWRLSVDSGTTAGIDPQANVEPVARARWRHDDDRRLVACEVYLCADRRGARLRALAMLGRLLPFSPIAATTIEALQGDVAFTTADGQAIVATHFNAAVQVHGASAAAPLPSMVAQFFAAVVARLVPDGQQAG